VNCDVLSVFQTAEVHKERVKTFEERVVGLVRVFLEVTARAAPVGREPIPQMPPQIDRFKSLLDEATACVQVRW
jgi:hypothetical protein